LANAKQRAIRTQCLNNEKQQAIALTIYAGENNDYLPMVGVGYYPWDIDADVADQLIADGTEPLNYYDPGTEPAFGPVQWVGAVPYGPVGQTLWTRWGPYPSTNSVYELFRITGYAQTFSFIEVYGDASPLFPQVGTNVNQKLSTTLGNASQKTLLACANITPVTNFLSSASDDYATFKNYSWTGVAIPDYDMSHWLFNSAHLQGGTTPIGGNEAMLDGHVEWRPFQNMIDRTGALDNGAFFYY
jgi:hypothetical protein